MKPSQFSDIRIISVDTIYHAQEGLSDGAQTNAGTLQAGRCVWVQHDPAAQNLQALVPAYVEGIGIISLDLHSLFPAAGGTA